MMVYACAPCRILDIGSWTDTAFAEHGTVMNCAASLFVRVVLQPSSNPCGSIRLRKDFSIGGDQVTCPVDYHFLRVAARHFDVRGVDVSVTSDVGPGHGFGISAAVAVAITGALAAWAGRTYTPHQLAAIAHHLDVEELGRAGGIESYLASALGGVGLYHIAPYPRALPVPVTVPEEAVTALEDRLIVVTIRHALSVGLYHTLTQRCLNGDARLRESLWQLRLLAAHAIEAIGRQDYSALGGLMTEHTRLQQLVAPALASADYEHVRLLAYGRGALAVKANGSGGSVTVLCPPDAKQMLEQDFRHAGFPVVPVRIDPWGVRVRAYDFSAPRLLLPEFDTEAA